MSILTLILGNPGTGKSTSMRNMDPAKTLLIQAVRKPLPFRSKGWSYISSDNPKGNIFVTDSSAKICDLMKRTGRPVVVVDDSNYVMSNAFIRRASEKGYDKFTEMAQDIFSMFETASNLEDEKRVYFFAHTQQGDDGIVRFKTIGKLLDEKVSLDGLVTICLRTLVRDGQYLFSTKNNGSDTVKSPMGLFESDFIDNDSEQIDAAICEYFELPKRKSLEQVA